MNDLPEDAKLIDLLVLWWRYESQWRPRLGFPTECPTCAGYRPSRQYDDANGAMETDQRGKLAISVGHAVNAIPEPWRTALYTLARNRSTGAQVWRSARLPAGDIERARVVADALDKFGMLVDV